MPVSVIENCKRMFNGTMALATVHYNKEHSRLSSERVGRTGSAFHSATALVLFLTCGAIVIEKGGKGALIFKVQFCVVPFHFSLQTLQWGRFKSVIFLNVPFT